MCTGDCGSDRNEISKYKCIKCGNRTRPHRSRLTPSGFYVCVACKKEENVNYGQPDPIFTFNGVGIM